MTGQNEFIIYCYSNIFRHSEGNEESINEYQLKKLGYVYILASKKNGTLYIGVTSNLLYRIEQHKNKVVDGFTKKYNITTLVYYEIFETFTGAVLREKKLKGLLRKKKIELIEMYNPEWEDISFYL